MRFLLTLFCALSLLGACDWKARKNEGGIAVSTRCNSESPIDEFRAIAVINAKADKIAALIDDVGRAPEWVKYCKKGQLLKRFDQKNSITYTVNDLPWPLTDRDSIVLNKKTELAGGGIKIDFESRPDFAPKDESLIRIRLLRGAWLLEPVESGTRVTYQVLSDPGSLPAWMVNLGIVEQPFETLQNLKKMF